MTRSPSRRQILTIAAASPFLGAASRVPASLRLVLLGQSLLQHDLSPAQWPEQRSFAKLFAGADVCFSDLETAIKGPHAETPQRNDEFLHAADASVIDCLKRAGITMFATSNNHASDFGPGGVMDAIEALDARGLVHAGTGADWNAAGAPGYRTSPRGKVALVAMASGAIANGAAAGPGHPGVNEMRRAAFGDLQAADLARYFAAIAKAATQADVVIAYQHNHYWEKNMADTPPWQRELAYRAIDAGASVFVSHGAPLLQGIEIYKRRPIFYDLGGFFFQTITEPGRYPPEVWQSVIADCRTGKDGTDRITLLPVKLNDTGRGGAADMTTRGMPALATGAEAENILHRLGEMSAAFGTRLQINGGRGEIVLVG